ncbi:LysR family transcriptional regulator [Phaeobacter sp. JH20_02]|uniref:LysR family transcriptional regulator n=1 Tax=Phaeobacter TaxID=302485 RepID=UPI000C9B8D34|nr:MULTISPECIES: LysR family transcriptional regulator [Phaeobacter]AUQ56334.1 HTH-type transcriptional regulator, LysR family [Phaeobacter inhibens]AUQ80350.1 HTH-type transcriptional regulator, LysR family [Phaeobacter inhibens]AUR17509.1 HTH-type transcriptional regulator, LysR family [Phaeobacter inhibens]AUR37757.1 HTH-type transcriptional regulator, LysR family [Phaeobacter piscinae]MDO6758437.1 LysR family transcriptional regulator [Phaeobacter inhibens]
MRANHHQFVAFAYVVREGSFSAAAVRLGVTQSAVTQHIAKLEKQVGSQLLVRGRDGISLTRTGQEFYGLADRMVALDSEISERLEGYEAMTLGHIKIIANAPLPALKAISRFRQAYPEVEIDFALYGWTAAINLLRERRADVGLITDPPHSDDWERVMVQKNQYTAYLLPTSPLAKRDILSFKDLQAETVILPETGSLTERVVREAQLKSGVRLQRTITMSTFPLMCEAVLQGAGIAIFLSESGLISRGLAEVPIAELTQQHETAVVAPKDRAKLRLVKAFIGIASS